MPAFIAFLINLLILLLLLGFFWWLLTLALSLFDPVPAKAKTIITIILGLIFFLALLSMLGVWGPGWRLIQF